MSEGIYSERLHSWGVCLSMYRRFTARPREDARSGPAVRAIHTDTSSTEQQSGEERDSTRQPASGVTDKHGIVQCKARARVVCYRQGRG